MNLQRIESLCSVTMNDLNGFPTSELMLYAIHRIRRKYNWMPVVGALAASPMKEDWQWMELRWKVLAADGACGEPDMLGSLRRMDLAAGQYSQDRRLIT